MLHKLTDEELTKKILNIIQTTLEDELSAELVIRKVRKLVELERLVNQLLNEWNDSEMVPWESHMPRDIKRLRDALSIIKGKI